MRASTVNKLNNVVTELQKHFKRDEISNQEIQIFRASRTDLEFPMAFWNMGKSATKRATYDLTNFKNMEAVAQAEDQEPQVNHVLVESDNQISERIAMRFAVMDMMANAAFEGNCRSLIIAGAPGVGKSFTILKRADKMDESRCSVLKGAISPTGLFKTLWKHRHPGHVIVFDDADDVFGNERSLNFLKAACDSSDERYITWASNAEMIDDEGDAIPTTFEFEGSIIFISNKDFIGEIERETRSSVHFAAMISRSHFIDTGIKTNREYFIRIKQVVLGTDMLNDPNGTVEIDPCEILQFIEENLDNLNELSLRMVKKLANLITIDRFEWRKLARVTCFKPGR